MTIKNTKDSNRILLLVLTFIEGLYWLYIFSCKNFTVLEEILLNSPPDKRLIILSCFHLISMFVGVFTLVYAWIFNKVGKSRKSRNYAFTSFCITLLSMLILTFI
jgi:hypothetical protein